MLGIIGGMGPMATAHFYRQLVMASGERPESRHVPVIIIGDPRTPPRPPAIGNAALEAGVLESLLRSVRRAEAAGATMLAMPCNTAHLWLDRLRAETALPFLSMVETAQARLGTALPQGSRLALLGTAGTLRADLYGPALRAVGLEPLPHESGVQADVEHAIASVKANQPDIAAEALKAATAKVVAAGADAALLACTELAVAADGIEDPAIRMFDSGALYAEACVEAWDDGAGTVMPELTR